MSVKDLGSIFKQAQEILIKDPIVKVQQKKLVVLKDNSEKPKAELNKKKKILSLIFFLS